MVQWLTHHPVNEKNQGSSSHHLPKQDEMQNGGNPGSNPGAGVSFIKSNCLYILRWTDPVKALCI